MPRWTSLPFLYSLSNLALIAAQSFNITVDDQFGPLTGDKLVRIEYSSSDDWVSGGYGVNGLRKGSPSAAGFEDTIRGESLVLASAIESHLLTELMFRYLEKIHIQTRR